jgi:hypothetical protein
MISNEQIRQTINDCSKAGHSVGMRDISYILLCKHYDDRSTAYRILFGLDADFNAEYAYTYDQTAAISYLRDYAEFNFVDGSQPKKKKKKISEEDDISFEENKAEILNLIKATKQAFEKGEIEAKDALKIEADLRVKLNDKFSVTEDIKDQIVVVNQKYDAICGRCGAEVARRPISKEEAMKMYDLIEKD